jgi:glyoxylase-like metal-dependent hydrolase (beta-lactamase superfamily II)
MWEQTRMAWAAAPVFLFLGNRGNLYRGIESYQWMKGEAIMTENIGIRALRLDMRVGENPFVVHAAVLWDENELILVDTGIQGQLDVIRSAFEREQLPFDKLTKIIITHQDRDHIGGLSDLLEAFGGRIEVLAHEAGVPYLQGEIPLIKSGVTATPCKVDVALSGGDILPWAGGIQIIHTPGHAPDHISIYHTLSKTLISGDALTSEDGALKGPNPEQRATPDMDLALRSVSKLRGWEIESVVTYHGGVCKDRIAECLAEIAES